MEFKKSWFRHVESRQSNSVPIEEMWRYGNSYILSFSNVASLSMQRPFRMTAQISYSLFKHTILTKVNQLVHLCGLHARSGKYAPANYSRTQKEGALGRHLYAHSRRLIVGVHRLTAHPCNGKWTVGGPEEKRSSQMNYHLPVVQKKSN